MSAALWFAFGCVVGACLGIIISALIRANGPYPELTDEQEQVYESRRKQQ